MKTTLTIFALLAISSAAMSQTKANGSTPAPVRSSIVGGVIPGGPIVSSAKRLSMTPTTTREKAIKAETTPTNPLYKGNGKSGNNPMHQSQMKPGSPIGGIVVRGAKPTK